MQYDICFKTTSRDALVSALEIFGLTHIPKDNDGNYLPRDFVYGSSSHTVAYIGQIVDTPAAMGEDMTVTTPATYLPGEYAILRAEESLLKQITAATMDGVEVLAEPPQGCRTFGEWKELPLANLAEVYSSICVRIDSKRDVILQNGFSFSSNGADPILQTRGDEDRINWLGVLNAATVMVISGRGTDITKIRTANNDTLEMTYSQVQMLMLQTLVYQSSIYEAAWKHKDDASKLSLEELSSYDIEIGWPS